MAQLYVGQGLLASEDPPLLRGEGRYVADIANGQDTSYMYFLRSPFAAARIEGIHVPEGIRAITAADLSDVAPIGGRLVRDDFTSVMQPILPSDFVHFAGQAVVAVIARSLAEAEDLSEEIVIDYEPLSHVTDIDLAVMPGAPIVHSVAPNNCLFDSKFESPGIDAEMRSAAEIIDVKIVSHREHPLPLECRGGVASHDVLTGRTKLIVTSQRPHVIRTGIADSLGFPEGDLEVIVPDVGGAFGNKAALVPEQILLVWAARKFKGSIAWLEDRRDSLTSSTSGRGNTLRVRAGFSAEGRLLALDADANTNAGAFSFYPITGAVEALQILAEMPGPYRVKECRIRSKAVLTNSCPMGGNRGVARPNITLTLERIMDLGARKLGLDPVEIRRRNLAQTFPYTTVTGLTVDSGSYVECLERAAQRVDVEAFRRRQSAERESGRYIGLGFSSFSERTGYGTPAFAGRGNETLMGYERVELEMGPSANVIVRIGASPHGQGLATTVSQVIADQLGVDPSKVRVIHSDTDRTPYGAGSSASRGMVICGGACLIAARKLGEKLRRIAASIIETSVEDVELRDGYAFAVSMPDSKISIEELARAAYHRRDLISADESLGLYASGEYDPSGTFSNGCFVAEVCVDSDSGHVQVSRFIAVEDAGTIVNPLIANGQLIGGIAHGIGGALFEELTYDDEGNLITSSLMDYLIPCATDVPPIEIDHFETFSDATVTGAKGLGESGPIGAQAAVINAISDALQPWGVELFETPATPERVRAAILSGKTESGKA